MFRFRHRLANPALLALPALALGTSCVPQPAPPTIAAPKVETRPAALLRDLALDVPPGITDATATAAALPPRIAPSAAPPFLAATRSDEDAERARACLTAAVYYEARSESTDGQRAVAQVVLNRVRDRAFPGSVCGVVYQGSNRRTGCQFSFTCDGSMAARIEPSAWDRARRIAEAALSGAVYAPIGSATFYHADYVLPWWAASMARIGSIGAHVFYTWRGAMERALAFRQSYAGIEPSRVAGSGGALVATAPIDGALGAEQELVAGVTIHRGGWGAGATAAQATLADALAPTAAPAPLARSLVAGVRIHVGERAPKHIVVSASRPAEAVVGEETDPT